MKAISWGEGNGYVHNYKSHSYTLLYDTDNNIQDALRATLERYQKYCEQHPEVYENISINICLPFDFLRTYQAYAWFIPFSNKLNIILRFISDIEPMSCRNSADNIISLTKLGLSISFKKDENK